MSDSNVPSFDKTKRPLTLLIVLNLIIIANILLAIGIAIIHTKSQTTSWFLNFVGVLALLNIAFAFAIYKWHRIGFYGLCVTSLISFALNVYLSGKVLHSSFSLLCILVLALVVFIGGEHRVWDRLK